MSKTFRVSKFDLFYICVPVNVSVGKEFLNDSRMTHGLHHKQSMVYKVSKRVSGNSGKIHLRGVIRDPYVGDGDVSTTKVYSKSEGCWLM